MALFFIVAFVATFVLSQAAFWMMRNWHGGMMRLLAAHAISLVLCWAWFAFGSADRKVYLGAGAVFLLPQGIWFLVDYFRGRARARGETPRFAICFPQS
jgi:hypothetical protein